MKFINFTFSVIVISSFVSLGCFGEKKPPSELIQLNRTDLKSAFSPKQIRTLENRLGCLFFSSQNQSKVGFVTQFDVTAKCTKLANLPRGFDFVLCKKCDILKFIKKSKKTKFKFRSRAVSRNMLLQDRANKSYHVRLPIGCYCEAKLKIA